MHKYSLRMQQDMLIPIAFDASNNTDTLKYHQSIMAPY